ncbi:MAG: ATP-binding cassette domain-containing protein, partial [Candidatus Competibacteraceae bacterium]|nr:ATP-binding cassette domain-containing protein [Candidatus Competibacteraceae bacterium]
MTIALETRELNRRFGALAATDNVTFKLQTGARHALIGPNGAGKTTLINLLTGVITPSSGTILLSGHDITSLTPNKRVKLGLARTFQISQLFPAITPFEAIGLAVSERLGLGWNFWRVAGTRQKVQDEIFDLATRFGLSDVLGDIT